MASLTMPTLALLCVMVYSAAAQSSNNNFNNNQYSSNQNYNNQNNNNMNMNNNNNWNNNNNNQMWRDSSRGMYGNNYNNNNNQYGMYSNRGGQSYYGFNKFNSFNIQWQNDYEGNHRYACANGQYMTSFKATKNHPKKKDRMFQVGCGGANAAQNCTWSEWMNDINADFFYQCPDNKVMTGMSSMANPNRNSNDNRMQGSDGENSNVFNNNNNYRETGWQDRQFKSACCMVHNKTPVNCRLSDWVNNWNEFFTWWTRHASVINGIYSEYSPAVRDRRWKFVYCDLM